MTRVEKTRYLIIGNSAGGIGAAEAIRETDEAGVITIVSDEPYPAYSRPLISEYLASRCPVERMLFRPSDFYHRNNIQTLFGEKVTSVDFNGQAVNTGSGLILGWEKLLLATGGLPIVPRIDGAGLKGVFTFNKLEDARAINEHLSRYQRRARAVVIGGGLIGVSVTEALVKRRVDVTIVEMKDRILNTILDEEASALEERTLRQAGIDIISGHTAAEIGRCLPGESMEVSLDDGRLITCELVIIAVGVQPRLELVQDSEIQTKRGIVVDRRMATSRPDVYACGDVAEAYDFVYGENRLTPIWPNAYAGGRIAGMNMAGISAVYPGGTSMNSLKYFGLNIVSAGMVIPTDDSYETISDKYGDKYKKVILKDGKIVGMVLAGDIDKAGIIYNLMKDGVDVSDYKEALVAEDFGLAYLPEEIWGARLQMPAGLTASLITDEQPEEARVGD